MQIKHFHRPGPAEELLSTFIRSRKPIGQAARPEKKGNTYYFDTFKLFEFSKIVKILAKSQKLISCKAIPTRTYINPL